MSLPVIDRNEVFSRLEHIAFRGLQQPEVWKETWSALSIQEQIKDTHTSPDHDRYQALCAVYGFVTASLTESKSLDVEARDMISKYVHRYPSSASQLPSDNETRCSR